MKIPSAGARLCAMVATIIWVSACGSSSDDSDSKSSAKTPPVEVAGCEGAKLLEVPEDFSSRGPWPVGVRTLQVPTPHGVTLTVEVWYPASLGSDDGKKAVGYDIRKHLPPKEQSKIPDDATVLQMCDCYRDPPLDAKHGPYPAVVFIHGTASFRTQSLRQMVHWASRGFVVLSASHPGIRLSDMLWFKLNAHQTKDAKALIAAVRAPAGVLAFLGGHVDAKRLGVAGHSAGGMALEELGGSEGVQVAIPMAARGTKAGKQAYSTLVMGGIDDAVVPYADQQTGFDKGPAPKRLIGLAKAGHLAFADICIMAKEDGGLLGIAKKYDVALPKSFDAFIDKLATDGCKEGQLPYEEGAVIVDFATAAAFEERLHCRTTASAALEGIAQRFSAVGEYKAMLE